MTTNAEKAATLLQQYVGKEEPPGDWFTVDQARINQFADCTLDHQFIHVDPEASAKLSPYKVTIAHGFLTLSLLTHLAGTVKAPYLEGYAGIVMGVNYGFEKVRFPSPVKVNSRVRMRREISAVDLKDPNSIQLTHKCTVEVDGEDHEVLPSTWERYRYSYSAATKELRKELTIHFVTNVDEVLLLALLPGTKPATDRKAERLVQPRVQ